MEPTATIIMPTLDMERAAANMALARRTAGVDTSAVIYWDYKARGAVKSGNALFHAALHMETPFIVYLNDDCRCEQQGWLALMIRALQMHKSYGSCAPYGNCRNKPQRAGKPGEPFAPEVTNKPLSWFCAVIRREALLDVGLFDEAFIHYGDESDWIQRAWKRGWKQVLVRGVFIQHTKAGGNYTAQHQEWDDHDGKVYRRKWPSKK